MSRVLVRVKAFPGFKKEKVERKEEEHTYNIYVREPAERGMANDRIRTLVALRYGVSQSHVRMLTGRQGPSKTYEVTIL